MQRNATQRSAASLPLQSASCLTCYRLCVLIYALEPTDELEPAPQPLIYLSHLSRPSTRRPPPRSNQLDPGLLALPRLFQPAVPQINPSRPRNPAKVNNLGRGRRRREKAQPNKGTQPLLQNQDCDQKREGEIEDQPDATRRAAAALPLDTSSSTGHIKKERQDQNNKAQIDRQSQSVAPCHSPPLSIFFYCTSSSSISSTSIVIIIIIIIAVYCSSAPAYCMFASAFCPSYLQSQLDKKFPSVNNKAQQVLTSSSVAKHGLEIIFLPL